MPWNWLKIEIYDFNQYGCSPEKGFIYEMELLWKSFFPKTSIYFFKVYYYHTGCPKKRKIPYNGLKIEIYEFNHFSYSPQKVFLYEVETFWSLFNDYSCHPKKCFLLWGGAFCKHLVQIHTYPYSKCISYCGYVCIV